MKDKTERDKLKSIGVELRDAGRLEEALKIFREVEDWDIQNGNVSGQMDVLGHIRALYTRFAEREKDPAKKKDFYQKALETAQEAIKIGEKNPGASADPMAIQEVHLANAILDTLREETDANLKRQKLSQALSLVNHAIENLPGSMAHRAWPANLKAKIEYELGSIEDSLHTLVQAQEWVLRGYGEEMVNDEQAEHKLNMWLSGLMLTTADICAKEKKPFLARHYANAVLNMPDPNHYLVERKKEAERILRSIRWVED